MNVEIYVALTSDKRADEGPDKPSYGYNRYNILTSSDECLNQIVVRMYNECCDAYTSKSNYINTGLIGFTSFHRTLQVTN